MKRLLPITFGLLVLFGCKQEVDHTNQRNNSSTVELRYPAFKGAEIKKTPHMK